MKRSGDGVIGAYYARDALSEYALDVLGPEDPGLMVNVVRMTRFHDGLADQVMGEVTRYIEDGLLPYLKSDRLGAEEKAYIRECVVAALAVRRRITGMAAKDFAPLGLGATTEEPC